MEAFVMFESDREREGFPIYMNLEVNANGALLAAYGKERVYQMCIRDRLYILHKKCEK